MYLIKYKLLSDFIMFENTPFAYSSNEVITPLHNLAISFIFKLRVLLVTDLGHSDRVSSI
jgi:hypothetical protein